MWFFDKDKTQWRKFYSAKTYGVVEEKKGLFHFFFMKKVDETFEPQYLGCRLYLGRAMDAADEKWEEIVQSNRDFNFIENAIGMIKPEPEVIHHVCKCCAKVHTAIPDNARAWNENGVVIGWFFECGCQSTMFIKNK